MEIVCLPRKTVKYFKNCDTDQNDESTVYLQPPRAKILNPRKACKQISAKVSEDTTYKEFFQIPKVAVRPLKRFQEVKRYGEFQFATTTHETYKWPVKTKSAIIKPQGQLGFVKMPIDSATIQKDSYVHPRNWSVDKVYSCKRIKDEKCRVRRPMESITTTAHDFIPYDQILYKNPKEKSCKIMKKCLVAFKSNFTTVYQENFKITGAEEWKRPQKRRKENRCPVLTMIDCKTEYNVNFKAPGKFIKLSKCR